MRVQNHRLLLGALLVAALLITVRATWRHPALLPQFQWWIWPAVSAVGAWGLWRALRRGASA